MPTEKFTIEVSVDDDCTPAQIRALLGDALQNAIDNDVIDDFKIL